MSPLFVFLLKSAICAGVLFAYYLLSLKNRKMHGFNRWYLVSSAVVSALLPLVHIDLVRVSEQSARAFPILQVMGAGNGEEEEFIAGSRTLDWTAILSYAYFAVSLLLVAGTVARLAWVLAMCNRYGAVQMNGYRLVRTTLASAPFSFGNMLFWNNAIDMNSNEGRNILVHELTHIRQRHTADKLLLQLILACCWLNPFLWLVRKELWLQHEFIADEQAIDSGDTDSFARMLLYSQTRSTEPLAIVNSFFHSPIKRRLMMLTQSKKTNYARMRKLLAVPLLLLTVFIFSFTIDKSADVVRADRKMTIVLDAAHGGQDKGGAGPGGVYEKDLALRISQKMMALAGEYNIEVIPTREDDEYPTLNERLELSNSSYADLFISLHVNKGTADSPAGNEYEVGVSRHGDNYQQSLKLASAIVPRLKATDVNPVLVEKSSILVLRENRHAAVLIEFGNIEDAANLQRLADDKKLEEICRSILAGIVDYGASK